MSTLKATNIKNESSASNNIVLDSGGGVVVSGVTTFSSAVNFSGSGDITLGTGTTISSPASDTFTISTNGSERVRVDSSGRLAVGTTNPSTTLNIVSDSSGLGVRLHGRSADSIGTLQFRDNGDTATQGYIQGRTTGLRIATSTGNPLLFLNEATEQMRLDSSGRLLVGTASANLQESRLGVLGDQTTGGRGVATIRNTSSSSADDSPPLVLSKTMATTTSAARFIQFYANGDGTPMGGIVGNGPSNVQFASLSDIRDKENIEPVACALERVRQLEVVSYDWKTSGEHVKAGFIAQNVEAVFPEYVVENMSNDGQELRKGVTGGLSSGYVAVLTAAFQEAVAKIETLEAKVAALESA